MNNILPGVAERFLRYVRIDTQSDPESNAVPSTEKQKNLLRLLKQELMDLGASDVAMDDFGYVYATLPGRGVRADAPVVCLLAHVDTSPDAPGTDVKPIVHPPYEGGVLRLPGDPSVTLDPARQPDLLRHLGQRIISSDGTTLLGSDDKAGVAVLMQLAEDWATARAETLPTVRLCFTFDEEIGKGVAHLDLKRVAADVAYTLDGSSVDTLEFETFNAAEAVVSIRGIQVHPGYAKDVMVNALRVAGDLIAGLPAGEAPETTSGREGYIHPHTMNGRDGSYVEIKLILRDFSDAGMERRKKVIASLVDLLRLKYPRAEISLEIKDQYRNMRSYIEEKDGRAVQFALDAAREIGIELTVDPIRGGTDGAHLSEQGLPTPNIFNGGYDYHSKFEWNTVENLEHTLDYTWQLLQYWGKNG